MEKKRIFVLLLSIFTLVGCGGSDSHATLYDLSNAQACDYFDYQRRAAGFIENAGSDAAKVKTIAGMFALIHLREPDLMWWAGMASIAQSQFVGFVLDSRLANDSVKKRSVETISRVYRTGFVPLFIYLTGGLSEIERVIDGSVFLKDEVIEGLRQIDMGRKNTGPIAKQRILAGNSRLLAREHRVLQRHFYRHDLGLLAPALSTFACANFSDSVLGAKCFAATYPFSSFQNEQKRTSWNTDVLLPSFAKHYPKREQDLLSIKRDGRMSGAQYPDFDRWHCVKGGSAR